MLCAAILWPASAEPGLAPILCGVRIRRSGSTWRSESLMGSGSSSNTSNAAPVMIFSFKACTKSASLIAGPREVLTINAVGFISLNSRMPIMPRVSRVKTTCSVTRSDCCSNSSSDTIFTPSGGDGLRLDIRIVAKHFHAPRAQPFGDVLADAADADDADRFAQHERAAVMQFFPAAGAHVLSLSFNRLNSATIKPMVASATPM